MHRAQNILTDIKLPFAHVVKETSPEVVNLYESYVAKTTRKLSLLMNESLFLIFSATYLDSYRNRHSVRWAQESSFDPKASSSPITIVVKNSDAMTVILNKKREHEVTLIRSDE